MGISRNRRRILPELPWPFSAPAGSGEENIPPGGCIIAAKHQSDWDVFAIFPYTGRPAYIVKKELMRIPFFGWAARSWIWVWA